MWRQVDGGGAGRHTPPRSSIHPSSRPLPRVLVTSTPDLAPSQACAPPHLSLILPRASPSPVPSLRPSIPPFLCPQRHSLSFP